VTLERFGAVLEWFGPFAKGDKLFKNVLTTIRIKYRHRISLCAVLQ
jgi:hypothetical protein